MSTATLDASMTRLENIKGNKEMYNKEKIAEAEALAAEALRMANEAKLAAARLAEVKKTLSMFSNKLEKAEQSVQKDDEKAASAVEKEAPVEEAPVEEAPVEEAPVAEAPVEEAPVAEVPVEEAPVEEAPVEEAPAVEEEAEKEVKVDPPLASTEVVSENLVNDDVVKVVETKPVVAEAAPKEPVATSKAPAPIVARAPAPIVARAPPKSDIVEDFFDGIGLDKMCGVDDKTLGLTDKPPPKPFENPTKMVYKSLSPEAHVHATSAQQEAAAAERKSLNLPEKNFQTSLVNEDFVDPFGVDHDDLVLCGKMADLCEPPELDDDDDANGIKA